MEGCRTAAYYEVATQEQITGTAARKRAVAYVRVSTASDAQLHSYEFQEEYWHKRLDNDANTEMVGIYADKGISGCSLYRRPQFLVMMQDARDGKFDVIYTKSVSRFARNTVDLLESVRELRDLGIEVIFETENISTLLPSSEIYLTIAASIAENDLEVDSMRQRWSIHRRCEEGWISIGNQLYGYEMTADNNLVIIEDEAKIVRRIYDMYLNGAGCTLIAKTLNEEGLRRRKGIRWHDNHILDLIANEKYKGDCLMGKSVYHYGVKKANINGSLGKQYYIENTHEGIVSRDVWDRAQQIRLERKNPKVVGSTKKTYPFAGMIICGQCGKHYQHKINNSGKKWQTAVWYCATGLRHTVNACDCTSIKDSVLREKFVEAYNEFVTERPQNDYIKRLQKELECWKAEERELGSLYMERLIAEKDYRKELFGIKDQIAGIRDSISEYQGKQLKEKDFVTITEFNEEKVQKFLSKVIMLKGVVTFEFYNGIAISKEYTNGAAGNKPGWNKKEVHNDDESTKKSSTRDYADHCTTK